MAPLCREKDRSRLPQRRAIQLPFQVECSILQIKRDHPSWGALEISEELIRTYPQVNPPARSMVHAVLDRHGLVTS